MKFLNSLYFIVIFFCLSSTTTLLSVSAQGDHNGTEFISTCVKYAGVDVDSQIKYVSAIVSNAAFGNVTYNESFIGLFGETSPVLAWFDGSYIYRSSGVAVNFTLDHGNNTDASTLLEHMIAFLGPVLGCNATAFPNYTSDATLYDIHRNMNYGKSEFDFFVQQFIYSFEWLSPNVTRNETDLFAFVLSDFGRCAHSYNQVCNDVSCDLAPTSLTTQECDALYPSSATPSLCSRYTSILSSQNMFKGGDSVQNEQMFLEALMNRTFYGSMISTPHVPGIFATDSPLLPWFNGSIHYRADAPDYVTNSTQAMDLIAHFVSYIGDLFTCSAPGWNTQAYKFRMGHYDMFEVHRNMNITNAEMTYFLTQLDLAIQSFAFSEEDRTRVADIGKMYYRDGALVLGFRSQICGEATCDEAVPSDPSLYTNTSLSSTGTYVPPAPLCERYFGNVTSERVGNMTLLMQSAFFGNTTFSPNLTGIFNVTQLKGFFNGDIIYRVDGQRVDFTLNNFNNDDFMNFLDHMVSYFLRVFECFSEDMPPIANSELWAAHRNMPISGIEFALFNDQIALAASERGFTAEDAAYIKESLNLFGTCAPSVFGDYAQICNANLTGAAACPVSTNALFPDDCAVVYQTSVCTRLTYLNTHYDGVENQRTFLADATYILFHGSPDGTVEGLFNVNSTVLPYFDGSIKYNGNETIDFTNYTANSRMIDAMLAKTYTHLGELLGCDAPGIGTEAYNFSRPHEDLYFVHKNMAIPATVFDTYNQNLVKTLRYLGAAENELDGFSAILRNYGKCGTDMSGHLLEICSGDGCADATQADCSIYPGSKSDGGSDNKKTIIIAVCVSVGAVILIALAWYCYRKRGHSQGGSKHENTRLMDDDIDTDYRSTR
jgi:hypothetical protein